MQIKSTLQSEFLIENIVNRNHSLSFLTLFPFMASILALISAFLEFDIYGTTIS